MMADEEPPLQKKIAKNKQPHDSDHELEILLDAILEVEPRLLGVEYNTTTATERDQLWEGICDKLNAVGTYHCERFFIHKRRNDLRRYAQNTYAETVAREHENGKDGPDTIKWDSWEKRMYDYMDPTTMNGLEDGLGTEQSSCRRGRGRKSIAVPDPNVELNQPEPMVPTHPKTDVLCSIGHPRNPMANVRNLHPQPMPHASNNADARTNNPRVDTITSMTLIQSSARDDTLQPQTKSPSVLIQASHNMEPHGGTVSDEEDTKSGPLYGMQDLSDNLHSLVVGLQDDCKHKDRERVQALKAVGTSIDTLAANVREMTALLKHVFERRSIQVTTVPPVTHAHDSNDMSDPIPSTSQHLPGSPVLIRRSQSTASGTSVHRKSPMKRRKTQ